MVSDTSFDGLIGNVVEVLILVLMEYGLGRIYELSR